MCGAVRAAGGCKQSDPAKYRHSVFRGRTSRVLSPCAVCDVCARICVSTFMMIFDFRDPLRYSLYVGMYTQMLIYIISNYILIIHNKMGHPLQYKYSSFLFFF